MAGRIRIDDLPLWTTITFEDPADMQSGWYRQRLALERSGETLLNIVMRGGKLDDFKPENAERMLDIITPHAPRWRSFRFTWFSPGVCEAVADRLRDLQLSNLETLDFGMSSYYDVKWATKHVLSPLHIPALRHLRTNLVPYDFTSSAFSNLRTLYLSDPRFDDGDDANKKIGRMAARILTLCPLVERITIRVDVAAGRESFFLEEDLAAPPPSIHNYLSFLDLNDLDTLMVLIEQIELPRLSEVVISEVDPAEFLPEDVVRIGAHKPLSGLKELLVSVTDNDNPSTDAFWHGVGTFTSLETLAIKKDLECSQQPPTFAGGLHRLGSICPRLKTLSFAGWHPDPDVVLAVVRERNAATSLTSLTRVVFDPESEDMIEYKGEALKQLSRLVKVDFDEV